MRCSHSVWLTPKDTFHQLHVIKNIHPTPAH